MRTASWFTTFALLAGALAALPPSSPRKSINFGPKTTDRSASIFSNDERSAHLVGLNQYPAEDVTGLRSSFEKNEPVRWGEAFAASALHQLHPSAHFELTGSHVSSHTGVGHYYFVQKVSFGKEQGFARISNAVADVHVDVDPTSKRFGQVLKYSESFHDVSGMDALEQPTNFHHVSELLQTKDRRLGEWAQSCNSLRERLAENGGVLGGTAGQQVLGGVSALSATDAERLDACHAGEPTHLSGISTDEAKHVVDPRIALVSFLTVAADPATTAHLASSSLDDLVESMYLRYPLHSTSSSPAHRVDIMNAPGRATVDHGDVETKAELAYLSVEDGKALQLCWRFEWRGEGNWYEGYVDATRPSLVASSIDWVKDFRPTSETAPDYSQHQSTLSSLRESFANTPSPLKKDTSSASSSIDATYRVFDWSVNDPSEGDRVVRVAPHHTVSSEAGWHMIPPASGSHSEVLAQDSDWWNRPGWSSRTALGMNATDTRGNNAWAQENWEGMSRYENNARPDGGNKLNFDFPLHWGPKDNRTGKHIDPKSYVDASTTELFFTCNEMHDLFYLYGFDEVAGNFQEYNFGRGGKGGDAVIANSQDGSGYNNANFATPLTASMAAIQNGAEPWRDGDLEAGIVIHEFAHGISTRLTGGPANSGCLGWGEAGGMGEGWGDTFATLIRMHKKKPEDFTMGEWASGMKGGIRKYKYSLNHTVNVESYKTLDKPGYWGVHAIGEVWAEMLYTVAETLIAKHGFEHSLFPPANTTNSDFYVTSKSGKQQPRKGNTLFLQLVVDGMKLQPCRPSFMDARDAIIQADEILTDGDNACEIWEAFSSRGLGPDAELRGSTPWGGGIREEDYSLPKKCRK